MAVYTSYPSTISTSGISGGSSGSSPAFTVVDGIRYYNILNQNTWEAIALAASAGIANTLWKVGDCKDKCTIMGFNEETVYGTNNKAPITFLIMDGTKVHYTRTNNNFICKFEADTFYYTNYFNSDLERQIPNDCDSTKYSDQEYYKYTKPVKRYVAYTSKEYSTDFFYLGIYELGVPSNIIDACTYSNWRGDHYLLSQYEGKYKSFTYFDTYIRWLRNVTIISDNYNYIETIDTAYDNFQYPCHWRYTSDSAIECMQFGTGHGQVLIDPFTCFCI